MFAIYFGWYKKSYQSQNMSGYNTLGQEDDDEQDEDLQMFLHGSSENKDDGLA